jgi:glycosyltransferase involved in cell wall biosynthesis
MHKTLSIVIPVYNEEAFLKHCLEAIARQTVMPDEVIVVDNNSTDRSMEIARSFPFVTIMHEPRQGIVHARNTGFNATTSEIICRLDAETILPSNWTYRVRRFYDSGHKDNYGLTGGGYFYNVRLPRVNGWAQSQIVFRLNRFLVGHYVLWGSNMALPRVLWLQVRDKTCERQDIHEDLDLSFHLHDMGVKITYHGRLRVGVYIKRVFSNRDQQRKYMDMWPQSLRVHGYRHWRWIILINWLLWLIPQPIAFALEYASQLIGKKPLNP